MSLIWSNATTTDFNNPIEYLKRRINFLKDRRMDDYFEKRATDRIMMFDDSLLSYNVRKSPLILEAPYVLEARLESDDFMEDSYQLPSIFFGLDNDTCHIYAIQNKGKVGTDLSKYQKSIKRKMNKVKKGFSEDIHLDEMPGDDVETFNINYPENITSVDPSFLVSLTVNLALLNNVGISNIVVPDFYPVRFNSQQIITNIRANYQLEDEKEHFLIKEELQSDRINRNIVDKKIRTFRRLAHHFDFLNVDVFPKEVDDFLHVSISDNYCCNNEVLDQVYTKVDSSINENKHRRI